MIKVLGSNPLKTKIWFTESFACCFFREVTSDNQKKTPLKKETKGLKSSGGRNHTGKITIRHRGGGHKRSLRKVSFNSTEFDSAVVERIEYDPSRSAKVARLFSTLTKEHLYIVAPEKLEKGSLLQRNASSAFRLGNSMPLKDIPLGTLLHCVGSRLRFDKGVLQRSAGTFAQLLEKTETFSTIRLSSGENKKLSPKTLAVIGGVSKTEPLCLVIGKAGRNRWKGIRPSVRGVAMNPVDHPHGGGEGKSSGGRPSVTPWAKPAHGKKTRKRK
jgi:large subunit ribosomal protein L2